MQELVFYRFLLWPSDSNKNLAQGPEFFANINKNHAISGHFQLVSARTATSTLILRMQYDLLLLALRLTQIQARHTIPKTFCRFCFRFFPFFFPKHTLIETKLKRRRKCNSRRPVKKPTMRPKRQIPSAARRRNPLTSGHLPGSSPWCDGNSNTWVFS